MAKLECCDTPGEWRCQRCKYYACNPLLVCAEHPTGVEKGADCPDFELDPEIPDEEATAWYGEQWQPEETSYYGGELVLEPAVVVLWRR